MFATPVTLGSTFGRIGTGLAAFWDYGTVPVRTFLIPLRSLVLWVYFRNRYLRENRD